jgi:hypothetical protein
MARAGVARKGQGFSRPERKAPKSFASLKFS